MLRVIPNRLKAKSEELLAEEQAGFRPGQSTAEQILDSHHLKHQHDLFHNFIDFKVFDSVGHAGLWLVLRGFSIDEGLVKPFRHYMRTPAVQSSCTVNEGSSSTQQ